MEDKWSKQELGFAWFVAVLGAVVVGVVASQVWWL